MKTNIFHKLTLIITILLSLFLFGCNQEPDVSQFITNESYHKVINDCGGASTADFKCVWGKFEAKVDKHCSENKLPSEKCEQLKVEVVRVMGNLAKEDTNKFEKDTKKINEIRENLKKAK